MEIPIPDNDAERVAALHTYAILDTPPEQGFDDITELAAQICECPVAGVNMIDEIYVPATRTKRWPSRRTLIGTLRPSSMMLSAMASTVSGRTSLRRLVGT